MRRTLLIIGLVVALGAAAFLFVRQRRATARTEVEILRQAQIERGSIAAMVNATGTIEPEASVSLSFGVPGTIQEVGAVRGRMVAEGDVLASLDTAELALAVQQAEDALHIQELTLEQAQTGEPSPATLAAAEADIDAAEGNLVIAGGNQQAAEAAVRQAEAARQQMLAGASAGQIAAAEAQVAGARLQRDNAQQAYDRTLECVTITMPNGETQETCPGLGPLEEQARANLENANANLAAAEAQLADLQSGPTAADLAAADAAIAAAQAQVESARGSVLVAEANVARAQAALDRLSEGPAEAELAILQAQVTAAGTTVRLAQLRLEQAMLVAPMAGRVAAVLITPGEQATPGAPAVVLVDEAGFHLEVSVDEIDIDQITVGQEAAVVLDALPDREIAGTIGEIAPTAATSAVGVVTYLVTINLTAAEIPLRPGMTANATIVVEEIDGVLVVPNWAVRLDRDSGDAFVNRLRPDGTVEEVAVVTGLRNEQFSELLSGLGEGDVVVVTNEREGLSFFGQ
jgi:HlyD family secretion protein